MSTTTEFSPYVAARREWDERYGDLLTRAKNWRTVALVACLAAVASGISAIVGISRASHIAPFVAVVDGQGHSVSMGYADAVSVADDRLKRSSLQNWVSSLRLVTTDGIAQRKAIDAAYSQIASGSAAQTFISDWYRSNTPAHRAETETVSVDVTAVLPTSDKTYEVDWTEITHDLYGNVKSTDHFKGSFQLVINPPTDEALARRNPLGIYVTSASWSKVL
jgi:type IV secretory pathway TrbF-like protein